MIEPEVSFDALNDDKMSLRSIAISLKRIADILEKPSIELALSTKVVQPDFNDLNIPSVNDEEEPRVYWDTAKGCYRKID